MNSCFVRRGSIFSVESLPKVIVLIDVVVALKGRDGVCVVVNATIISMVVECTRDMLERFCNLVHAEYTWLKHYYSVESTRVALASISSIVLCSVFQPVFSFLACV